MEPNDYLKAVLAKESLSDDSPEVLAMVRERHSVEKLLREKYGDSPSIRYGGSKAKGTMIRDRYDLDLPCYFPHDDGTPGETLEDIYHDVQRCLGSKYRVEPKTSALRLHGRADGTNLRIDVVPGRFVDGASGDVFLYQAAGSEKRLKTNLEVHLEHVRKSGLIDEIKLGKLWDVRSGVQLKTFVLELLVIKLLKGSSVKGLTGKLLHFWKELRDKAHDLNVEDPANPAGNDLSSVLHDGMKQTLASVASRTLDTVEQQGWESVFGPVEEAGEQEKIGAIEVLTSRRSDPPRLWCPRA